MNKSWKKQSPPQPEPPEPAAESDARHLVIELAGSDCPLLETIAKFRRLGCEPSIEHTGPHKWRVSGFVVDGSEPILGDGDSIETFGRPRGYSSF